MRLTLRLLGTEVFHISTDPETPDNESCDLSGGTAMSTPINVAWRPGQGMEPEPWSDYEE